MPVCRSPRQRPWFEERSLGRFALPLESRLLPLGLAGKKPFFGDVSVGLPVGLDDGHVGGRLGRVWNRVSGFSGVNSRGLPATARPRTAAG